MAITVVGSVAFDSVETPAGRYERKLAGAATYFSLAASFFTATLIRPALNALPARVFSGRALISKT
jgi:hypothetical protein